MQSYMMQAYMNGHGLAHAPAVAYRLCVEHLLRKCHAARGHRAVYIGDGAPDYSAAASADFIFARARLRDLCESRGVRYHAFDDFMDIIAKFEEGSVLVR